MKKSFKVSIENQEIIKPRFDVYRKARGSSHVLYEMYCGQCGDYLFVYQKDGPGKLFRMYVDRILTISKYAEPQTKQEMVAIKCTKCGTVIATPMVYEKENWLAYRIIFPLKKKLIEQ